MPKDDGFLLDMLLAARLLRKFAEGTTWEIFQKDEMIQSAIRYQGQVLGEAANQVSSEFRRQHREIPWDRLIGLRHRLVHGYRDVELDRVWRLVERDASRLISALEKLVPQDEDTTSH